MNLPELLFDICRRGYRVEISEYYLPDTIDIRLSGHGWTTNYVLGKFEAEHRFERHIEDILIYLINKIEEIEEKEAKS